jgi:UDP-glucose 4-epimerase
MKILVTGGAGFIGSHVAKQLIKKNHEVVVYDNLSRGFRTLVHPKASFVRGSLSEKDRLIKALNKVDAVIHMAAFIIVPESVEKPSLYWENNVVGTKILLEAMNKAKVRKIIFSSSATVYGNPDKLPLTEEAPIKKAANPYGQTKIEMERLIKEASERTGMSAIILRYFNPYGPNELHKPETHAVPNFVKAALNREPIPVFWKGEQIRDFIYVEDLAAAHVLPLSKKGFHVYNVGTGEGTRVVDIVRIISEVSGVRTSIKDLGERAGDVASSYTATKKIESELSWKSKTSLEAGLKKTFDFYRDLKSLA